MKFSTIFEFSIAAGFAIPNFSLSTVIPSKPRNPPGEYTHSESLSDQEKERSGNGVTEFPVFLHGTDATTSQWTVRNFKNQAEYLRVRDALQTENILDAINIINEIGFPRFKAPLNDTVEELEVTRRLLMVLNMRGILSVGAVQFYSYPDPLFGKVTKGIIDIATQNLKVNYAMEIKCSFNKDEQILKGVKQQLGFVTKDAETRLSFLNKLGYAYKVHLLTIHFDPIAGGRIDGWVFIPFRGGKLKLGRMKTSSEELYKKIDSMIKTEINPMHVSYQN